MRFKEGDKVEFIYRNKKSIGEINGVFPETQILAIKQSDSPVDLLFSDKAVVKVEEQELVVVPQFVADWLNHCKQREYDLACLLDYGNAGIPDEMYEWLISSADNQELLARAWLDGYEVEKEPLYYVRLPLSTWNDDAAELEVINMYVLLNIQSDETTFTGSIINKNKKWKTKLTEAEIKGMQKGEIYWLFAVLVEEAEGEA
ncbi:DUF1642 domain-containing protein [Listeria monocytogenes]|nr:DUF1642 domain-containing protein [Listeria monocytogenes]EAF8410091.1 DUF1642 domain-containing protein [Listeria monocytogenes]EGB9716848.1 DUF1642 domain-containing protein [Listeria monocytogenes]EGB9736388.1 DUF1642 domain-containing protein [Listeria monocytogenes]ELN9179030.1 DUF1642 domain-containing protein [Listeria monocytogenes]